MSLIMTVEIPALDRLCDILEERQRVGIIEELKNEICKQLREAAESGAPRPEFKEVPAGEDEATTAPEPQKPTQEPPKAEPTNAPVETAEPTTPAPPVTLEGIQLAAAQMRDEGKLKAVTDLFPEFGIKKLSDLKGDKLQAFGERLRAMGAKV